MIGYVSLMSKHDVGAASSVTLVMTDLLGQHLQDKPPIFNAALLNENQTQNKDN